MLLDLTDQEVANLMTILTQSTGQPWVITHPLIMKIGQQQQMAQQLPQQLQPQEAKGNSHAGSDLDQERGGSGAVGSAGRNTATH